MSSYPIYSHFHVVKKNISLFPERVMMKVCWHIIQKVPGEDAHHPASGVLSS